MLALSSIYGWSPAGRAPLGALACRPLQIPYTKCKNWQSGCSEILSLHCMATHEKFCTFRRWRVPVKPGDEVLPRGPDSTPGRAMAESENSNEDTHMIPYTRCMNWAAGCTAIARLDLIASHESTCGFRQVRCLHKGCGWVHRLNELAAHLAQHHNVSVIEVQDKSVQQESEHELYSNVTIGSDNSRCMSP
ncbi:uncharacterized protein LOC142574551 [Dermacentor variabilis]|uniref:uncharacterized protein LOC142574551 n=1 Tax=Dermacentor variabilis TaxID=34621 RepID=UPI003F5C64DF